MVKIRYVFSLVYKKTINIKYIRISSVNQYVNRPGINSSRINYLSVAGKLKIKPCFTFSPVLLSLL